MSSTTTDILRITLGMLMLITIGRANEAYPFAFVFRPGLTLTALCLMLSVMRPKSVNWKYLSASTPVMRVLIVFALIPVSAIIGLSFGASITLVLNNFLPTMIFFALLVVAMRDVADMRAIIASYVVSMLFLIYSGFFLWETTSYDGFARVGSNGMYDANDLAPIFGAGLPLALLFAQTSGRLGRWFGYSVAALTPALIAITGSRGGFLALLTTALGLLVMSPSLGAMKKLLIVGFGVVAMAVVAPEGYMKQMGTIFDSKNDYNRTDQTGRVAIWKRGMGFLAEHPVGGVGIGNFARAQWSRPIFSETGAQVREMAPHNSFVEVLVELGIPTFLIWFSVVISGSLGLAMLRTRLPRRWLKEDPEKRFLYLACSYLPVSYAGWSVGAFFVSHGFLAPYYVMAAILGNLTLMVRRAKAASSAAAPRAPSRPSAGIPAPLADFPTGALLRDG